MANLYGVANPLALPATYGCVGAANVACPAGTETTIITSGALTAISSGFYYPMIWCTVAMAFGGGLPGAIVFAFKIGSGSDVVTYTADPASFVASVVVNYSFVFVGAASQAAWSGSGSTINVTCAPTTNATSAHYPGSIATVALFRAPDQ